MKQISDNLYLPDETLPNTLEIYCSLLKFGLKEGKFTFAAAKGGVLCYIMNEGLLWVPDVIIEVIGAEIDSNNLMKIGSYTGGKIGTSIGTLVGVYGTSTILQSITLFAGISTGGLAIPILAGGSLGALLGSNLMKNIGLQDAPNEITSFSSTYIHHINYHDSNFINNSIKTSKKIVKTGLGFLTKKKIISDNSVILSITPIYGPNTSELNDILNYSKGRLLDKFKLNAVNKFKKITLKRSNIAFTFSSSNLTDALIRTMRSDGIEIKDE